MIGQLLCYFGFHRWRRIRRTHYNSWSGVICERCSLAQDTFSRYLGRPLNGNRKDLSQFIRSAGGDKPDPWRSECARNVGGGSD